MRTDPQTGLGLCLYPKCKELATSKRGVCNSHLEDLERRVVEGKYTLEKLEFEGVILPDPASRPLVAI